MGMLDEHANLPNVLEKDQQELQLWSTGRTGKAQVDKNMFKYAQYLILYIVTYCNIFCIFYVLRYVQYVQDRPSHIF